MSLEAIKEIRNAEDSARTNRAETAAACKRVLSEAETDGKDLLDSELSEAANQERGIYQAAEAQAETEAEDLLKKAAAEAAELEKAVEKNISKAASFIVERIVSAQ